MSKKSWISLLVTGLLIAFVLFMYRGVERDYDWPPSTEDTKRAASETAPPFTTPREPEIDDRYTSSGAEDDTESLTGTEPVSDTEKDTETPTESDSGPATQSDTEPGTESSPEATEPTPVSETEPSPEAPTEPAETAPTPTINPAVGQRLIFLGDSRTVGLYCSQAFSAEEAPAHYFWHIGEEMYAHLGPMTFVAHGGTGFDWLSVYAFARAVTWNEEAPSYVFWFGINDLQNVEYYISYINNVALTYGRPVYYLTVGPAREDAPAGFTNADIDAFNARLRAGVQPGCRIIEVNAFMQDGLARGEMHFIDQLHYDYGTYQAVFNYVISQINGG